LYLECVEGGDEELWGIAKKVGVQHKGDDKRAIRRFKELEDRDSKLIRQACCDREDDLL